VQRVGPEHFGIVSVDCAKARFKWMLCDFYAKVLIAPTTVEHNRPELDFTIARLRAACQNHVLRDLIELFVRVENRHGAAMMKDPVVQLVKALEVKGMAHVQKQLEANPMLLRNPRIGDLAVFAIGMWGDRSCKFVRFLLDRGVSPDATCNGQSLIEWAVLNAGGPKVVRLLLERGGNLKRLEKGGRTLLLKAVCVRRPKAIIDDLIRFGVKKDLIVRVNMESPKRVLAEVKRDPSLVRELDDPVEFMNHSMLCEELVELLLDLGVDPNGHGPNQDAPLRVAVRNANVELVRLLLDRGANPEPKDAKAGTSLLAYGGFELAVAERRKAINELLVARGAKTDPRHDEWMKELEAVIPRRASAKRK
jgi:ankyrin repeat protein